jgi:hypothetical protein
MQTIIAYLLDGGTSHLLSRSSRIIAADARVAPRFHEFEGELMKRRDCPKLTAAISNIGFILSAAGILIAVLGSPVAVAKDNGDYPTQCREEVWQVAITAKGGNPKYTPLPRFEKRTVLVCDEKFFAEWRGRGRDD